MIWIAAISVWVVCSVLAYGFMWGSVNTSCYNWCKHSFFDYVFPFFGPTSLISIWVVDGFGNWSWGPMTRLERFKAHEEKYEILRSTYNTFDR